jgi:hypothetical protein
MVASPQLSRWFYEHQARNRRLPSADDNLPSGAPRQAIESSGRRRGFAPGSGRAHHLTADQRQSLIALLEETHNVREAHRQFIEAGHTLSKVAVWNIAKREGIELRRPQTRARLHQ